MKARMLLSLLLSLLVLTATPVLAQTTGSPDAQPARSKDGDRASIEHVQKALKDNGHDPGRIDGVMGPRTTAALRAYQKEQGLAATGQLDDATLAKLDRPEKAAGAEGRASGPGSRQTGGDTKPSAVDPGQANKTGANVGEGASYSRSSEKGQSTVKDGGGKK